MALSFGVLLADAVFPPLVAGSTVKAGGELAAATTNEISREKK
jgi:hypothetical protein